MPRILNIINQSIDQLQYITQRQVTFNNKIMSHGLMVHLVVAMNKSFYIGQNNLVQFSQRRFHSKIKPQPQEMGIVMHKLIQIGQYCDCLQNWKKYEIGNQSQSQSNLFMSQNDSNLNDPFDKVFDPQKIESGLDKQLQMMHERLRKRKKLKAEYFKQKDKQLKAKQLEQERKYRQTRQKIQKQRQLWLRQQELRKVSKIQAEKLRKQDQQKNIRANKRNNRIREKNLDKQNILQVDIQNNTFSTADQNAQKEVINQAQIIPEQKDKQVEAQIKEEFVKVQKTAKEKPKKSNKNDKKTKKAKKKKRKQSFSISKSSSSSYSSGSSKQQNYKNIFQQPQYYHEQQRYIPRKDKLQYHQEQVSDLDSALFSHRKQQKVELEIIDFQKLNQKQLRQEVSQMVIKKLRDIEENDRQPCAQTVPLHPAIHSHRVSDTRHYDARKHQLIMTGKDQGFDTDAVDFVDTALHSTIIEKDFNGYFLDQNDKEEYLKEMFR